MEQFIKKILLIITGIILSLFVLKCGLRFTGWAIYSHQQYINNKVLRNKSQYTIMCLGESTTARQYPIQLQQILNDKYPNKFSFIDCGIPRINLEDILDSLDSNINKYHPDIAICMMGSANITTFAERKRIANTKKRLKFIRLFILCTRYLRSGLVANLFADNTTKDFVIYVRKLISEKKYLEAKEILKKILEKNPNDERAFLELALLCYDYIDEKEIGYKMAKEGLNNNFNYNKASYYKIIFEYCNRNNIINKLKYYVNKAVIEDIAIFSSDSDIKYSLYVFIKNYITNEQKEKILKEMAKKNDNDYGLMAIEAINNKEYKKAQEYFDKAEEIRLNFPNMHIYNLYKQIVKELIDNNIKVICMQYPVRSIKSLQEQLKNEPYYDKITFISNEQLFKNALMKKSYNDLFIDQFAGDFGHCTKLGNTIIVKNVVNTLEKILNLK